MAMKSIRSDVIGPFFIESVDAFRLLLFIHFLWAFCFGEEGSLIRSAAQMAE